MTYDLCVLLVENGADVLYTAENGKLTSEYCESGNTREYRYLKQKEAERRMLNASFKRAQLEAEDDSDNGEPEEENNDI